jgi:exopolyphosphatase/guanosine-5'-triphosphate,3'-diphosphate pyrophosphatase
MAKWPRRWPETDLMAKTATPPSPSGDASVVTSPPPGLAAEDVIGPQAAGRRVVAAIDIGTNSIHLLIAAIDPTLHSFSVVQAEKATVRLGERDPVSGNLSAESVERALLTLRHCRDLAQSHGAEQILTAATSAVREAPNGRDFLLELERNLGLAVDLISGPEEARLIYLGVLSGLPLGALPHYILDIGGGSTELILADGRDARSLTSTRIGAVRLQREFCQQDPLPASRRSFLEAYIQGALDPAVAQVRAALTGGEKPVLVGTSGTAMALAALAAAEDAKPAVKLNGFRLSRARVDQLVNRLVAMSPEQRRALTPINERRAEIIVPGALILQTAMAMLQAHELVVCDRALREGLIVDWMLRNGLLGDRLAFQSSIRERTVRHLARSYGVDTARAERVAGFALSLYEQTRGALHDDDGSGRQLLWAAAQLHSCGKHINIAAYHKHTWYLIRHGELLGYSEAEHLMVAAIARYHRRGLPKKRHESWQLIQERDQRQTVSSMALLLRLAAALDRRPAAMIRELKVSRCSITPGGKPVLEVTLLPTTGEEGDATADLSLERWSLRSCAPAVLESAGIELRVPDPDISQAVAS